MAWILKNDEELNFFNAIASLPDRVTGLLCSAIIEDRLKDAIKAQWKQTKQGDFDLYRELFRDGAPLSSLGTCIHVALAMGICNYSTMKDLKTISRIRNAYAHRLAPDDFSHQEIKQWSLNLTAPERFPITDPTKPSPLEGALLAHSIVNDMSDARSRFIRSIEVYTGLLAVISFDPRAKGQIADF